MNEQRPKSPALTSASNPLSEVREYLAACADPVWRAAHSTNAAARRFAQNTAAKTSRAAQTFAGVVRATTKLTRVKARQFVVVNKQAVILLICACLLLQPNAALATHGETNPSPKLTKKSSPVKNPNNDPLKNLLEETRSLRESAETTEATKAQPSFQSYLANLGELISVTASEPLPPPPVDAAVSRKVPSLSNGRVGGNLRVYAGQSFSFEGGFTVTDETYVVGTPTVTVATNATYNGSVDDGGDAQPTGYTVAVNGTSRLVGKLHIRANALSFPADIPTSVPPPAGTRIVNINTASDINNIGNWATLKELHINKSGETVTVPPGTYGAFSVTGNSRLNFSAGTYNFSDGFTFASNASIKVTGQTVINVGSSANISNTALLLGDNTLSGDVKLNVLGALLVITGNASIKALVRVPNGTAQVTGASVVRGQVIADTLQILSNGNVDGDTASSGPAETTPPVLAITSPANNSSTTSATITVSGTASDPGTNPSGIAQVTVNNAPASYNASNGTWTLANVPLAVGPNTITARATDYAGNQSTPQSITINRPDTTAPTVAITSPTNGSSTQSSAITVSGTAADAGANQSGVAQVKVNGVPASFNAQNGTWTLTNFQLTVGSSNPITAIATDHAGIASQPHTINVIRQPPTDNTAPTLTISSPADGSHTEAATITVTGTVADTGEYPSGVAQVTVNGVAATINGDCTWTRANVPLSEGPNPIVVVATDNAGNPTTQTRTVHRENLADTQAPTITITSPADNFTSSTATITVSGTANDTGANATGVRRVVVNGREATYDSATHQWTIAGVTLNEGSNSITAFAEDGATPPNRGDAAPINVTLHTPDTKAPTVTITSPLTSFDTYEATVNLAGTAGDDGLNFTGVQSIVVNGVPASYNAGTGQWFLNAFPLAYGPNHIVVTATDGAAPPNQAHAEVQVTRQQIPPPTLVISNPLNGAVLAAASITVAGSVSTLGGGPVTVTVNGQNATVSGGQFAKTVTLAEGANSITVVATDALTQQTQSSISVIRDLLPPVVSFANVPATVQPGSAYQILVDAVDNVGVADVEFRVNGQYVATATAAPYQFTLTVPLAYAPDTTLVLSAIARDLTNTTAVATAQTRTGGPGGISGYAFDDATGYVLPAVNVFLNSEPPAATDTLGVFNLVSNTPAGVVRLTKAGYTPVERLYSVSTGEGTSLFDARLTPLDSHANLIDVSGGTASGDGGRVQVTLNAGMLGEQADVRVTSLSPQGLANLLPYGWSPVPGAVIDVRATATGAPTLPAFQSPAHLAISQVAGLTSATPLTLARYDEAAHRWVVVATDVVAAGDGALSADLPTAGQYAFLVADTGSTAPPAPAMGQPLTAGQPADSAALDSAQATAVATPRSAVFSGTARSSISFLATAGSKLPSGVSIEASFGETYNLLGGRDAELVDRPAQDFVLYAYPAATSDQPNRLGAFFVAKPTRTDFTITEIFNANVHVEIRSGRQSRLGVLIDNGGGALRASDGAQLTIPANSISGSQTVFFNNLSPQLANVTLPEGYEVLAAYDVDLGSATLSNSATISVPGLTGDLTRIVVARMLTVGGQRSPKVVARAVATSSDALISTTTSPTVPNSVVLSGITTGGRYVFIRVPQAFGYVKGLVTEASSGAAVGMVKVSSNRTPFIDVTGADGQFVIVGAAGEGVLGANQIGAAALTTDATSTVNASLPAQDAVVNANIAVSSVPLQVESITPAAGAQSMIVTTPVTITFNKPVAASSITGSSLTLSTSTGNPVLGTITVLAGNRVAVFTPSATLAASTTYRVSLSRSVRDIYGHQLAADFSSTFSTAATITISNRLRPEMIVIGYPDANGMATISIPAGSVPEGSTILVVNTTSGSTLSTVAGTTALSLQILARVGDELALTISQPDGTQYRVTQAAYRRADGFISVGSNGGTLTSDDGQVLLAIPAGAISGQANLKLSVAHESDITIPRTGEMDPVNVPFGAGVRIDVSGTFTNNQELHLEVAAPPSAVEGQRVAFMKPAKVTEAGVERDVWEMLTSGKTEGGKFKTMSPPFGGVTIVDYIGSFFVDVYMPRTFRAVVGKVTELVPNHAPRPLENVEVTIQQPGQTGPAQVIARSAANGRFGTLDYAVSSGDSATVIAKDSLSRTKTVTATPYLSTDPTETGLNGLHTLYASVQFPSSAGLPETLPALLQIQGRVLDLPDGQPDTLQTVGRVLLGSRIEIKTITTPDVQQITGQLLVGGSTSQQLVWHRQGADVGTGVHTTEFTVNTEGSYSVVVTTFTQANVLTTRATATFGFVALQNPNTRPPLEGPPRVASVTPANGAQQVGTGTRIHLEFNEPVKNLIPGQTVYLTDIATGQHLGGEITSGGLPVNATTPNISSLDFLPETGLEANKEYAVEVTTGVKDTDDHALDQDYTSPGDTDAQPFRSLFRTFRPMVLTDNPPPQTISYRFQTAGDLGIAVAPTINGSTLNVFDISDPQRPTVLGSKYVPFFATAYDIAEAEQENDIITVETPVRRSYEMVAVALSYSVQDSERPINLWIYSLDDPSAPELIGVSSLKIPRSAPSYPMTVEIHHKRAYVGNLGRDSLEVVDLEEAVHTLAESPDPKTSWFPAVYPGYNAGFDQEAKKQLASYRRTPTEAAPIYSLSVMDQGVPMANGSRVQSPVVYVASSRLQLLSFDTNNSWDGSTALVDNNGDGVDDRLIGTKDLTPTGLALDVRTAPALTLNGQSTDVAVLLGAERLWLFNVSNPRDPLPYESRSFAELGLGTGSARRMDVEGTLAYVMFVDKVAVVDFSDPAHLFVRAVITNLGTDLRWISVRDGFVYTLDLATGSTNIGTANLRSSIGSAAAVIYVHGADGSACMNPVLISRVDDRMMQNAETVFKVYGHDAPQTAQVIFRRETISSGDQVLREVLATVPATLETGLPEGIVAGRASWSSQEPINRAATYTAELVLDAGLPTEFRSKLVPIVFSHLIDEYEEVFGVSSRTDGGKFAYILGGNAIVTLSVNGFQVNLENGGSRSFGLHVENLKPADIGGLPAGRYQFRLSATLQGNSSVHEEAEGLVVVEADTADKRQPGSIVVGGVEVESGNLALNHTDIPEIKHRGLSLSFTRFYNSQVSNSYNSLGYGWAHNYQVTLKHQGDPSNPSDSVYTIEGGEGSGQRFKASTLQAGFMSSDAPYHYKLRKNADNSFDFFTKASVRYHFNTVLEVGSEQFFNQGYMGNLSYMEEPNLNRITLSYDTQGRLASVADHSNRKLVFTYEQGATPFVGMLDTGGTNNTTINCTNRRFLRSLRRRFALAQLGLAWRIAKINGPAGLEITYSYDAKGNLERAERAAADDISQPSTGSVWQYVYDPLNGTNASTEHLVKSVQTPNSNLTTYEYELNLNGWALKASHMPQGVSNSYSYQFAFSRISQVTVTDGRGNSTQYGFSVTQGAPNEARKTVTVNAPRSAQSTIVFDGFGNRLSETDAEGRRTTTHYDSRGNVETQTISGEGASIVTSSTFDPAFSKPLSTTDGNQNVTNYSLDSRGNITRVNLPNGREVRMDYAANGDMTRMVDQYGFATTYQYDGYGNATTIIRQISGQSTSVMLNTFDGRSRLRTSQDSLGPQVENSYDALDHVVSQTVTDPSGIRDILTSSLIYLPEGQVKRASQTGGAQSLVVVNTYDGLNRLVQSVETPNGAGPYTLSFGYDANSNQISDTDRRGVTTVRTYDALNFLTSETLSSSFGDTLAVMTAAQIDLVGNPVRVLNLFGKETTFEYDGLHRMTKRHVPGGFTEEFGYDANGNTTSQKDRNERATTFTYDQLNRRTSLTDAAGRVVTWTYEDASRTTTKQSDPQGLTETIQLDGLGRILRRQLKFGSADYVTTNSYSGRSLQTTDARGIVSVKELSAFGETGTLAVNGATPAYSVEMSYGPFGGLKRSVDANGREMTYTLDGLNRATLVHHAGSFDESFSYDGEGNVISHTDLRGAVSQMTYDNLGRSLATVIQDGGQAVPVRTIAYDDSASQETHTDANGHATVMLFDGLQRIKKVTNADGKSRTLEYDGMNLRQASDYKGALTTYVYDPLDRMTQVTDRLGQVTNIVNNDSGGYTKSVTDRRGNVTLQVYDPLSRLVSVTEGGLPLVSYEYDGNDNRIAMQDGRGNRTTYVYDKLDRVTQINHAANLQTETFAYDAVGNMVTTNDGAGANVSQSFDELNHLKTRTDGVGNTTHFKYDAGGLLLEQTEPKGAQYKTTFLYNALGSLKRVTDAKNGIWEFGYDNAQNLVSIKDALNRTAGYGYDTLNRLQQITQPQQLVTTFSYDQNSNRIGVLDPKGQQTVIEYDALDRVRAVGYDQGIATGPRHYDYSYDPEGNVTRVDETTLVGAPTPTTRSYTRSYDARNRLVTATDPFNHTVRVGYDNADNVTSLTDAANKQTGYLYDARNRVQRVSLPNQATVDYQWEPNGLPKQVAYPSGMRRDYSYDPADRLTSINNHISSAESDEFTYTYDGNSNRKTETRRQNGHTTRDITYEYDLLDRLTAADYTASAQQPADPPAGQSTSYTEGTRQNGFDYDAVGNRTTATVRDRTTTITLTTDNDGVTTESRQVGDGQLVTTTAQFDQLNRLTQLTSNAAGSLPTLYAYDRNGNLTSTTQNNQVLSNYEYDGRDQLRRVLNGANQELVRYDYDVDRQRLAKTMGGASLTYVYSDDQVVNEYATNNQLANRYDIGAGEVIRGEFGGEGERYYFSDGQGSVTSLAQLTQSPPASLTSRYEYDAWGNYLAATGASYNSIGYTGQRVDGETGLMPLGNGERYYSPGLGSFIQQDSFTGMAMMAQSMNRYAYAHNNPFRYVDRNGNNPDESWWDYIKARAGESLELWNEFALGIGDSFDKAGKGVAALIQDPGGTAKEMWSGTKKWASDLKEIVTHPLETAGVVSDIIMDDPKLFMRWLGQTGGDVIIAEATTKAVAPIVRPIMAPLKAGATRVLTQTAVRVGETTVGRATAGAVREGVAVVRATLEPIGQSVKRGMREAVDAVNPANYRVNPNKLGIGFGSLERKGKRAATNVAGEGALDVAETGAKRPGGYRTNDVGPYEQLSPAGNRAQGHSNTRPDDFVQAHHPVQDRWAMENVRGYDRNAAPSVLLESASGMPHAKISAAQRAFRSQLKSEGLSPWSTPLNQEFQIGYRQMLDAGVSRGVARKAIKASYKYFDSIGAFE